MSLSQHHTRFAKKYDFVIDIFTFEARYMQKNFSVISSKPFSVVQCSMKSSNYASSASLISAKSDST